MSTFVEEATDFLAQAGYAATDVVRDCKFTTPTEGGLRTQSVDLVAFAAKPHDMQTACVAAFQDGPKKSELLNDLRFLTCPLAIVGYTDKVEFWPIKKTAADGPFDVVSRSTWRQRTSRLSDYAPASITSAKQGHLRFDFVDASLDLWTRYVTTNSLTNLLERLLSDGLSTLPPSQQDNEAAKHAVLRLVFHLFACRILEDKGVLPRDETAEGSLRDAHDKFSENISPDVLHSTYVSSKLTDLVFNTLREEFSFLTLTTDILAHSYENALVTRESRRDLGVHYTPPTLARYILNRLPIEGLPQSERFLWDPCCGSGSFLLAGFERLSRLLPDTYTNQQRHSYLAASIVGSDVDAFACELAAIALVLTDPHTRNGWLIKQLDAMQVDASSLPRPPTIVATNLPFHEIKEGKGKRRELSAEILERLLQLVPVPGLLGVIMPLSFLDGGAAKETRRKVLNACDVLEVALLPGGLFSSAVETAVVLLQRREGHGTQPRPLATIRELRSSDYRRFVQSTSFTRTYPADPALWLASPDARFTVSPLADLWRRLAAQLSPLSHFAKVRNGLQIRTGDESSVSEKRRAGLQPFIDRLDVMRPFALLAGSPMKPFKWIRYGAQLHRQRNPEIFESPKVLINSTRNPGSAWRLVAAVSREPLYFSDNFHAVLSSGTVSVEQLAAVLNSPIANAWFDSHCRKRKVVQATLEDLPFPEFDSVVGKALNEAVQRMEKAVSDKWRKEVEGMFYDGLIETSDTAKLLSEIDQLVYDSYGLSPLERRHVDQLMATDRRPG